MFASEIVKAARIDQDLTAREMAVAAGVTERQIWRYEAGKTEPSYSVAARIARRLGLDLDSLYVHDPESTTDSTAHAGESPDPADTRAPTDAARRQPVGAPAERG